MAKENHTEKQKKSTMGEYIVIGLTFGFIFGLLMDNISIGMAFGLCFGVIAGSIVDALKSRKTN